MVVSHTKSPYLWLFAAEPHPWMHRGLESTRHHEGVMDSSNMCLCGKGFGSTDLRTRRGEHPVL